MALVLQDRVKESSSSSGTGSIVLTGAFTGYRTFASCIPNGSTVYYCIHNLSVGSEGEWEVGLGTYTLSTTTLARTTVLSSSNAGSLVNFTSGANGLEVFITYPAEKAVYEEANGETLINGGPITVVGSNVTSIPALPAELGKFVGNINSFAQIYNYNQNSGSEASADFVGYNSDTDANGSTYFVDMGINSPNYSSATYPIFTPNSGYLISAGDGGSNTSTLFVGSGDADVKIFAGAFDANNTVATFGTNLSTTLAGSLNVAGTTNITGVTTLNALAYTSGNIAAAANNTVLVTKAYVDNATANGFHVHNPVLVATTGNLTATYNQPGGAGDGVGATLTNSGAQAALSIDGVSMNVNDRVLVWQQTTGTQNGVYVVTTVGSGSTNWVLTRSTDTNTAGEDSPDTLGGGDYFFVQSGSTLGYHSYVCTNTSTITFGSTAITFSEFSSVPAYVGGTNINVSGQTISVTGTIAPTNGGTGVNTVTTGDLLYGSASNTWSKLAAGAAYKSLVMNAGGTNVEWNAVALNQSGAVSGVLPETNGGTNNSTYVTGDMLYASGTNTLGKLSPNTTTTQKFLSQTGTGSAGQAPTWSTINQSQWTTTGSDIYYNTGNVGIGTSPSGTYKLQVSGNAYANNQFIADTGQYNWGAGSTYLYGTSASNYITFITNSTERLRLDSSGNLGLGVTPSASTAGSYKALYVGIGMMKGAAVNSTTQFSSNADLADKYLVSAAATSYQQGGGVHSWYNAASGTAGNAITFTQAMTLDASGRLGVGVTSPAHTVDASSGGGKFNYLQITNGGYAGTGATTPELYSPAAATLAFALGGSERMRIDSSGNVGIGTSSPTGKFEVSGANGSGTTIANITGGTTTGDYGILAIRNGTTTRGRLVADASSDVMRFDTAGGASTAMTFLTGSSYTERARISAAGGFSVGTTADPGAGAIYATGNITAYYSDDRLKTKLGGIENALDKVKSLSGFYYEANQTAQDLGYQAVREVGVSAQQVQAVMPEVVKPAPIDQQYLTVDYERLVPLLIEAIKELEAQVAELKAK